MQFKELFIVLVSAFFITSVTAAPIASFGALIDRRQTSSPSDQSVATKGTSIWAKKREVPSPVDTGIARGPTVWARLGPSKLDSVVAEGPSYWAKRGGPSSVDSVVAEGPSYWVK